VGWIGLDFCGWFPFFWQAGSSFPKIHDCTGRSKAQTCSQSVIQNPCVAEC
jgi:hypothetical protein